MSLGENLQFLRKKDNITQEQLAEKLDVSRQSISKWESDTTYPEMDKLMLLCQMFHCSMDDLLQKDISALYVEDNAQYDKHMNIFSKMTALGVGLILVGVSVMLFLEGIDVGGSINDEICTMAFFIFLIIAVAILIIAGLQHAAFTKKNPYIKNFYSENEENIFNKKFTIIVTCGVVLILIGVVIMIGVEATSPVISQNIPDSFDLDGIAGSVSLLLIAVAVTGFVYAGIQKIKYNIEEYNLSNDKESEYYKKEQLKGNISGCLMLIATIIYLILGFVFDEWGMPSIVVFPVFGIGCGIVSIIIDTIHKK